MLLHSMGVSSVWYLDIVLSLVITLYFAKMMAGYSILGFYPMEVMHSFKFIRTLNRFTQPLIISGLHIGLQLMDGLSTGRR